MVNSLCGDEPTQKTRHMQVTITSWLQDLPHGEQTVVENVSRYKILSCGQVFMCNMGHL